MLVCSNPECHELVDDWLAHCPECGHFVGFPNRRRAEAMRMALESHFTTASNDAMARGAQHQVEALKVCLTDAVATINVPPKVIATLVLDQPYHSYHRALELQLRRKAEDEYHAHRTSVDATIHPGYEREIIYAALNPNGAGLINYGPVTIRLKHSVLERRASLLRENAFHFFERFRLGEQGHREEPGWRAIWTDRAMLGVAHLADRLSPATTAADLSALILGIGETRADDRLIEVHVYGSINIRSVDRVSLDHTLSGDDEHFDWAFARDKLRTRGLSVVEHVTP